MKSKVPLKKKKSQFSKFARTPNDILYTQQNRSLQRSKSQSYQAGFDAGVRSRPWRKRYYKYSNSSRSKWSPSDFIASLPAYHPRAVASQPMSIIPHLSPTYSINDNDITTLITPPGSLHAPPTPVSYGPSPPPNSLDVAWDPILSSSGLPGARHVAPQALVLNREAAVMSAANPADLDDFDMSDFIHSFRGKRKHDEIEDDVIITDPASERAAYEMYKRMLS